MSNSSSTSCSPSSDFDQQGTQSWSPKRRDFMRVLGVGAGALATGGLFGCGGATAASAAENQRLALLADEAFWTQVQSRFLLDSSKLYMNIGTAGSMPRSVVESYNAENLDYARESRNGYGNFATQRTALAPGFGVDPDEIVISGNTSDGMSKAILGIPWQAGDVVITTNHEHPGGYVPLGIAVERYGVIVRRVTLPAGDGNVRLFDGSSAPHNAALYRTLFRNEVLAARAAGQRVRAIMWSSPTYLTGIMLPIREIMQVCKEFDLISICDGAHLPGMMAYNYADLGVDFMAGAGHKWQCGPGGTGILIVRNKARANAAATLPPYFPVITSSATQQAGTFGTRPSRIGGGGQVPWTQRGDYDIAAVLQSIGSMNTPAINAVTKAGADWDAIGRKKIETYVLGLSNYTKERIIEIWGSADALYSPRDPGLLSALTSFNPFHGIDGSKNLIARSTATNATISQSPSANLVSRANSERSIIVRNTSTPSITGAGTLQTIYPIRMSTHLWHDPADIDRALLAIRELAVEIATVAS
ncbi:aminotransferase class V-fold PLP-dependent enzyme [Piscinibacter sakaiensis]|uniref:aminotransferase class V-fold PLP-dependent enzyme n=1 Tax=Piscinibacter sakaiensis TaxID=1547922 RepID=UPI003AAB248D